MHTSTDEQHLLHNCVRFGFIVVPLLSHTLALTEWVLAAYRNISSSAENTLRRKETQNFHQKLLKCSLKQPQCNTNTRRTSFTALPLEGWERGRRRRRRRRSISMCHLDSMLIAIFFFFFVVIHSGRLSASAFLLFRHSETSWRSYCTHQLNKNDFGSLDILWAEIRRNILRWNFNDSPINFHGWRTTSESSSMCVCVPVHVD